MTYRLYRMPNVDGPISDGQYLGSFTEFDAALDARDGDAILLLGGLDGAPMVVSHVIVGPGVTGPETMHPVVSSIGRDDVEATVEAVHAELIDTRRWFRAIRAARRQAIPLDNH
jgi:hypothetical protein